MKKIMFTGSLAIILITLQLHAMQLEEPIPAQKRKIDVRLSPSASKELYVYDILEKQIDVTLGITTADAVLKSFAVYKNPSRGYVVVPAGKTGTRYRDQELKDAYDQGLLSLWTVDWISTHVAMPKEKIPVDAPITESHGNEFYIRYNR